MLSEVIISDVTDRSFSLIWTTDQQGSPNIEIYSDAAGVLPVANTSSGLYQVHTGDPLLERSSRSTSITDIEDAAKTLGIVKMTVAGLDPATQYYIKFSITNATTLESTVCPDVGIDYCPNSFSGLLSLITEQAPMRTASALLFVTDILLEQSVSAQSGELIILNAESANYPISAFVGDGVPLPYASLDVNNLFSSTTNKTLVMAGSTVKSYGDIGEGLVVHHYKGVNGGVTTIKIAGINKKTGALFTAIDREYGDCNSDGNVNAYDHMLLANIIADALQVVDYLSVAFHPVFCNLYKESGINSIATSVVIDNEDKTRLVNLPHKN